MVYIQKNHLHCPRCASAPATIGAHSVPKLYVLMVFRSESGTTKEQDIHNNKAVERSALLQRDKISDDDLRQRRDATSTNALEC